MITTEQIKELMAKAAPGPWNIYIDRVHGAYINVGLRFSLYGEKIEDTGNFIAALPEIAQLCLSQAEEIERLKLTLRGKTFTE